MLPQTLSVVRTRITTRPPVRLRPLADRSRGRLRMRNQIIRLIPMTVALAALSAAQEAKAPERAPVPLLKPVQDKNFYLLSMIEKTAAVKQAVENEPALSRIAASH